MSVFLCPSYNGFVPESNARVPGFASRDLSALFSTWQRKQRWMPAGRRGLSGAWHRNAYRWWWHMCIPVSRLPPQRWENKYRTFGARWWKCTAGSDTSLKIKMADSWSGTQIYVLEFVGGKFVTGLRLIGWTFDLSCFVLFFLNKSQGKHNSVYWNLTYYEMVIRWLQQSKTHFSLWWKKLV